MNNPNPNMNHQNANTNNSSPNMNGQSHQNDIFNDNPATRSPGAQRQQIPPMIHRQQSRQFDPYGSMTNNGYNFDEQSVRYDTNRFDRVNGTMPNGGYGYEIAQAQVQAQTWNANAFSSNNNLAAFPHPATGRRMHQPRVGRTAIPTVRSIYTCISRRTLLTWNHRVGWTNSRWQPPMV